MDRGRSSSIPYLPRYHSVSPARSPRLDTGRFTAYRRSSQPTQRIFYIDNDPTRVINSYSGHLSPSPHRAYKVRVISSTKLSILTRTTKSLSAHDLSSSHVYTSQEELFVTSMKEAAARRVGSCDDIYNKGPFFPDATPSESGVSIGESEEGSIFGGEDDNMSQHSFGSSSAFHEITMESELERGDSDNLSGPDSINPGDRALEPLYSERRHDKRHYHRSVPSPDTHPPSLSQYGQSRRNELVPIQSGDFCKSQSKLQGLEVMIPSSEMSTKFSGDRGKSGSRKSVSSSPVAQSTPHVSPRRVGETRFFVTDSWSADHPFCESPGRTDIEKSSAARALFTNDISDSDTRQSSRMEDSSCYSSCSEDNFSDISSATIFSPVPRKTKLVKRSSGKLVGAKVKAAQSSQPSVSLLAHVDRRKIGIDSQHRPLDSADLNIVEATTAALPACVADYQSPYRTAAAQQVQERNGDWWAVYNIDDASTQGRSKLSEGEETVKSTKPVKVIIPLISAGKHGQERLRRMSQTSPPLGVSSSNSSVLLTGTASESLEQRSNEKRAPPGTDIRRREQLGSENGGFMTIDQLCCHRSSVEEYREENQTDLSAIEEPGLQVTPDLIKRARYGRENWGDLPTGSEMANSAQHEQCALHSLKRAGKNANLIKKGGVFLPNENHMTQDSAGLIQGPPLHEDTDIDSRHINFDSLPSNKSGKPDSITETRHKSVVSGRVGGMPESTFLDQWLPLHDFENDLSCRRSPSLDIRQEPGKLDVEEKCEGKKRCVTPPERNSLPVLLGDEGESGTTRAGKPLPGPGAASVGGGGAEVWAGCDVNSPGRDAVSEFGRSNGISAVVHAEESRLVDIKLPGLRLDLTAELAGSGTCEFGVGEFLPSHPDVLREILLNDTSVSLGLAVVEGIQQCGYPQNCVNESHHQSAFSEENSNRGGFIDPQFGSITKSKGVHPGVVQCVAPARRAERTECREIKTNIPSQGSAASHSLQGGECMGENPPPISPAPDQSDLSHGAFVIDYSDAPGNHGCRDGKVDAHFSRFNTDSWCVARHDWQQEARHAEFSSDVCRPVVDKSIQDSACLSRGDKGSDLEPSVAADAVQDVVGPLEVFLNSRRAGEKPVTGKEISGLLVKPPHDTKTLADAGDKVSYSLKPLSPPGDISPSVADLVTDTLATNVGLSEGEGSTATGAGVTFPALTEQNCVDEICCADTKDAGATCALTALEATPTPHLKSHDGALSFFTPIISVSGERSSDSASDLTWVAMHDEQDPWASNNTASSLDQVLFHTCNSSGEEPITGATYTSRAVMHRANPLDDIQAQLSQIFPGISPARSRVDTRVVYQDYAEATSVLKEIVRGGAEESPCSNIRKESFTTLGKFTDYPLLTDEATDDTDGLCDTVVNCETRVSEEAYDNDYDYVTTDRPESSKPSTRHHHHLQLLKPGHLKASSLWTLQEETESLIDGQSPKPSPKRSVPSIISDREHDPFQFSYSSTHRLPQNKGIGGELNSEHTETGRSALSALRPKIRTAEWSDYDESDGHYSSISTTESGSSRPSSQDREKTPLSEAETSRLTFNEEAMEYQDAEEGHPHSSDHISTFPGLAEGPHNGSFSFGWANSSSNNYTQSSSSILQSGHHVSSPEAFKLNLSPNAYSEAFDRHSTLDSLSANLEQFTSLASEFGDDTSFNSTKDSLLDISDFGQDNPNNASTALSWNDDAQSEASSRLHALDLDLSRISSCTSPTISDISEGSMYVSTGTAEIRKAAFSFDAASRQPTLAAPANLSSSSKMPFLAGDNGADIYKRDMQHFDDLLNDFIEDTCPSADLDDIVLVEHKGKDGAQVSQFDDLYKTFTHDDTEKKQNHTCIVVEDEKASKFRFKRYLKKAHTKRKHGRKVLKFFSRLSCVSESMSSPEASPNKKVKLSDREVPIYSMDPVPSPKHRISRPVLTSSTSFHHHQDNLNNSPPPDQRAGKEDSSPSSSNQSLDSYRSRADSAYSSLSELYSPSSQRVPSGSSRTSPPSTSSSVFHSGSTSSQRLFSDSNDFTGTSNDFIGSSITHLRSTTGMEKESTQNNRPAGPDKSSGGVDIDMLSALSDVFEQLDVCEEEIDIALLNRMRYTHTPAQVRRN